MKPVNAFVLSSAYKICKANVTKKNAPGAMYENVQKIFSLEMCGYIR